MIYRIPEYYKKFECVAGECEATCCAGWKIIADKDALKQYAAYRGSFSKVLKEGINWIEGSFKQDEEKRCVFLNEEHLCDLYSHLGEDRLCRTCRLYPRHVEEFEGVREISLSASCPEAVWVMLHQTEPVRFLEKETEKEETWEDFDLLLYSVLLDTREAILKALQDRTLSIEARCGLVYGIAHDVQRCVNKKKLFTCGEVLEKYRKNSAKAFVERKILENKADPEKYFVFAKEMFHNLHRLELLKEDWKYHLLEVEEKLFRRSSEEYDQISEEFHTWIQNEEFPWELQKEQLLVYFIFTYFCGAVYDGQVLQKAQLAIISVDLLEEMIKVRWLKNNKILYVEDVVEMVYRYSREVEHSDENIKKIQAMMPVEHARFC